LKIPKFDLDLKVTPVMQNQELDTRGTTMIVYWEGACEVAGKSGENDIKGRAYVETGRLRPLTRQSESRVFFDG
jgi:predicted secreted hydrolase